MKNLIFINGTMGVGKTAAGQELKRLLPACAFLDGDWCWDMSPFQVTAETKKMVLDNICHLLNNFLTCSAYENIVFCWVMHEEQIVSDILSKLRIGNYRLYRFSLVCSEMQLRERLEKDIEAGLRDAEVLERSVPRLKNYERMNTEKINVGQRSAKEAAKLICAQIMNRN